MTEKIETIGIVGAGAWGTALACTAARAGRAVVLQAHEPEVAEIINEIHENALFLPGVPLAMEIRATTELADVAACDAVLLVTPAQFLRAVTRDMARSWRPGVAAVICAKGIEAGSGALMSEVCAETLPTAPLAVLSGPTFAREVAEGLPTAVTLACPDTALGETLAEALGTPRFRIYRSNDLVGAEIGGAVKNVLAIACGIVEGRNLGDNARAALITRGLSEIVRLALAKGGEAKTVSGLAGLGDLTLTCNALQSRNFSLGVALGEGRYLQDVLAERSSVAEGVHSAEAVSALARSLGVQAPICTAVDGILNNGADIDATITGLMARPVGPEDLT